MGKHTPLFEQHQQAGAKFVDFAGWEMPIHYGSQIDEHHAVRHDAGIFDVSHMTVVDVAGPQAKDFLAYLLANDVNKLKPTKALYSCMLNEKGGIVDDLIVYFRENGTYRLVVNSGTRDKDIEWIGQHAAKFEVAIKERDDLAMVAIQGPKAIEKLAQMCNPRQAKQINKLKRFAVAEIDDWFIGRTGYTGEDGVEIILPAELVATIWQTLLRVGVSPCGLGARDTLRLEAGMHLYGSDMDEHVTPLESGLAWTVAWEPAARDFIGRKALEAQKQAGLRHKFVGLVLESGKGVLRNHQRVICENGSEGEITSGSFSPTLGHAIAFARVPTKIEETCAVEIRGKHVTAKVVKPPFVRNGEKTFS